MKVVFLISPSENKQEPERVYGCSYSIYPTPDLAMLLNAATLEKAGYYVSIYKVKKNDRATDIPRAEAYFINGVLLSKDADLTLAKLLTRRRVFFYGPSPTLQPEAYLVSQHHYVIRGETEHIIENALKNPLKTKGISYIRGKKVIHNAYAGIITNLDSIPFPARHLDKGEYYNPKLNFKKFTNVLASRGCMNHCYFCVPNSISWARELEWKKYHQGKPPVVARSAPNVIQEIQQLKAKGYQEFSFIDDQFSVGKTRVLEILEGIKDLEMSFGLLARADRIDEDIIKSLAEAGCHYVDLGVESFNQEVLDDIQKDINIKDVIKIIKLLAKYKIEPKLNIMLGTSPKENRQKIIATINQTLKLPVSYCMFSLATPFPGTEFAKKAQKEKWVVKGKKINPASQALIDYPHLSSQELDELNKLANRRFYFRAKIIWHQIKKVRSFVAAKQSMITLVNWLKNW